MCLEIFKWKWASFSPANRPVYGGRSVQRSVSPLAQLEKRTPSYIQFSSTVTVTYINIVFNISSATWMRHMFERGRLVCGPSRSQSAFYCLVTRLLSQESCVTLKTSTVADCHWSLDTARLDSYISLQPFTAWITVLNVICTWHELEEKRV